MAVCVTHSFDLDPVTNTSTIFLAATLTCRGIYALMTIMGMYFIPHMTSALRDMKLIPQIVAVVVYAPIFAFPANGTQSRADTRRIIWTIAALINLLLPFVSVFLAKRQRFRLAVSIEHMTERIGLLVVIVLGEIVVNFLFDNDSSLFNMDLLYVTLSFLIATNLFYIYFTAEQSLKKQHAIRRHRMTGVAWNLLHFPLAVFVVCIGTCLNDMLAIQSAAFTFHSYANSTSAATSKAEAVASSLDSVKITGAADPGYMTFEFQVLFTLSVAMIHFVLAALQPLHLEVEPKYRETKISSRWRIVGRAMGGLLILILGLTLRLQAGQWIIVVATLTTFGTLFEEYGGLGHSLKQKRQCKADIYLSD